MRFEATYIDANAGAITANVMFAQPPDGDDGQHSVLAFSKVIEFTDTTYYFEVNDQSYSSYGGLDAVHLTRNGIKVTVCEDLVEEFGEPDFREIEATFNLDDARYQEVLAKLQLIFSEDPGVLTVGETAFA